MDLHDEYYLQTQLQQNVPKSSPNHENSKLSQAASPNGLLNGQKMEQKPVECNLCHRKFKNIPALNGHMRLHGGYFKKDTDSKKSDKKESSGPPLQTASVGVRALIEEKIINKRSKDLKVSLFAECTSLVSNFFLFYNSREHLLFQLRHSPPHVASPKQKLFSMRRM